jgi:hypothetical protein
MSDKRSVATDALETLGTIIDDKQKRDAIHLAVVPVIAGEHMDPGRDISVEDGVAWLDYDRKSSIGIVDPFLRRRVLKGEHFWCVIYPRTIQSLRHVWSHPAFPDEPVVGAPAAALDVPVWTKEKSERWLREFVASADCPRYETVIGAIADGGYTSRWDDEYLHFDGNDAHGEIPPEFWDHVEVVLGRKIEQRPTYFSCSC